MGRCGGCGKQAGERGKKKTLTSTIHNEFVNNQHGLIRSGDLPCGDAGRDNHRVVAAGLQVVADEEHIAWVESEMLRKPTNALRFVHALFRNVYCRSA